MNKEETTFLHILHNGQPMSLSMKKLFDSEVFHTLYAITYVASPRYFFHFTKGFEQIRLILGIPDQTFQDLEKWNPEKRIRDFQALHEEAQEKIRQEKYHIRYGTPDIGIHAKLFLLQGDNHSRVILGSANFSQKAFGNKNQFELIEVFDDDTERFERYLQWFHQIEQYTLDYVPQTVKKTEPAMLYEVRDPEVMAKIVIEDLDQQRDKIVMSDETVDQLDSAPKEIEEKSARINAAKQLLEIITKKDTKTQGRKLKTKGELEKSIKRIQSAFSEQYSKVESIDQRLPLIVGGRKQLFTKLSGQDQQNPELVPVGKRLAPEEIKKRLEIIHRFVEAYDLFTSRDEPILVSKVYEVILYGLLSPYIWYIRDFFVNQDGSESMRNYLKPFMILSGRAESGKTTVLEFIGKMLGYPSPQYIQFNQLGASQGGVRTKNLQGILESQIVSPVLVDEITPSFFNEGSSGEDMVKSVSNYASGPHPSLIGTTNTSGFSMPRQVARRVYYLNIDNSFNQSQESKQYLMDILNEIDSSLFRDFVTRVHERIIREEALYKKDEVQDVLHVARQIFLEYYQNTGMKVPDYFPTQRFEDYQSLASREWREIFFHRRDEFEIIEHENKIRYEIEKHKKGKEKQTLIQMLPHDAVISDNDILVLQKDIFYEFIGIENEKNWWDKLKTLVWK